MFGFFTDRSEKTTLEERPKRSHRSSHSRAPPGLRNFLVINPFLGTTTTAGIVNQGVVGSGNGNAGLSARAPHNNNPLLLNRQQQPSAAQYSNRGSGAQTTTTLYRSPHHDRSSPFDQRGTHEARGQANNNVSPSRRPDGGAQQKPNNNNTLPSSHKWVPPSRRGHVEHADRANVGHQPSYHHKYSAPVTSNAARNRQLEEEKNAAFKKVLLAHLLLLRGFNPSLPLDSWRFEQVDPGEV